MKPGKIKKEDTRVLIVKLSFTNAWRRVQGLDAAYQYIAAWSGHFGYVIQEFDSNKIVEQGRV